MPPMYRSPDKRKVQERRYQVKELNARHHEILRLHLLGLSNTRIAQEIGCTPETVSLALNTNLGRCHSAILRARADMSAVEAAKAIRELAPKAIKVIEGIMDNEDVPSAVRLRAAQDALDRAGFGAVKKVDMHSTSVSLSSDDLENLKQTALERAKSSGILIDADPIQSPAPVPSLPLAAGLGDEAV